MADDGLDEITRATDIILGALGFDGEAKILEFRKSGESYSGLAEWFDGEQFSFEFDLEPTDLESWALGILQAKF